MSVAVIGAGIAGAACAVALRSAGVRVDVIERGRAPGGRLAAPLLHGRRVDLGAAYFTVQDAGFAAQVSAWQGRGLVREWTDTLDAIARTGRSSKAGPMRWAAASGLRSLARDLVPDAELGREITELGDLPHDALVLAMPDPQAARLAGDAVDWVESDPVIAVAAGWSARAWDLDAAAFVNDDPDLTLIADDGARRGDGAAVLVLHTTPQRARAHLEDPDAAITPALAALRRTLGVSAAPAWTHAHRWRFAKPAGTHGDQPFAMLERAGRRIGICGDAWCPTGSPRVESAWLSGHRLGIALAAGSAAEPA